ncbi:unnamed protein product [Musa acuminata subsp. malaccensis]|uniref:(wild Malaysian banana) hypothetical protein n=1 Tax=Musa acuminata subsp. malaccensis TaxID=214687 RepID=A0A804ITC5_MUSAM|nr:unnamed protein product [Musa acuminata subsp. malaccensis]
MSFLVYLFGEIVFQLAVLRSTALELPYGIYKTWPLFASFLHFCGLKMSRFKMKARANPINFIVGSA